MRTRKLTKPVFLATKVRLQESARYSKDKMAYKFTSFSCMLFQYTGFCVRITMRKVRQNCAVNKSCKNTCFLKIVTHYLLLNFSTLKPTVGTMSCDFRSSGLKWFKMVDFPELSRPITKTLHSLFFKPKMLASLSNSPI